MHGTGTPLGDPIEVGAAVAVFLSPSSAAAGGRSLPFTLTAIKSEVGHAEPAAGGCAKGTKGRAKQAESRSNHDDAR